jgi:hypothetical protein
MKCDLTSTVVVALVTFEPELCGLSEHQMAPPCSRLEFLYELCGGELLALLSEYAIVINIHKT